MGRLVLINPPTTFEQEFGVLAAAGAPRPPLNLLNLGATAREAGHHVSILDAVARQLSLEEVVEQTAHARPDVIGITAMTASITSAGRLAQALKAHLSEARVVVGGAHITTVPEETMERWPAIDIGVLGEGDFTIVELLDALEHGDDLEEVAGLILRRPGGLWRTAERPLISELDELPFPAWDLLADYITLYQPTTSRRARLPSAYLVTSRGCPYRCSFCSHAVHKRRFRSYSVDRLMAMIDRLIELYGVRDITIYDENLAVNHPRLVGFCERLIDAGHDLTWSCDARADSLTRHLVHLMHRAGCRSVYIGMESADAEMLRRYHKGTTVQDYRNAARWCREAGIVANGSFIIGGPGETRASLRRSLAEARQMDLDYFTPWYLTPLPGAPLYDTISEHGSFNSDYSLATTTYPVFVPHGLSARELQAWYFWSLVAFYVRPGRLRFVVEQMGVGHFLAVAGRTLLNVGRWLGKALRGDRLGPLGAERRGTAGEPPPAHAR